MYDSKQNAVACLRRANAEVAQAARECDDGEMPDLAAALRRWHPNILAAIEGLESAGGAGGGQPRPKKLTATPPASTVQDLSSDVA